MKTKKKHSQEMRLNMRKAYSTAVLPPLPIKQLASSMPSKVGSSTEDDVENRRPNTSREELIKTETAGGPSVDYTDEPLVFVIGEYKVCGRIGKSSNSTVFKGVHKTTGKEVAIKVLSKTPEDQNRDYPGIVVDGTLNTQSITIFSASSTGNSSSSTTTTISNNNNNKTTSTTNKETDRGMYITSEYQIMAKLQHKHILQLIEVVENSSRACIIMEYARGGDLWDYMQGKMKALKGEIIAQRKRNSRPPSPTSSVSTSPSSPSSSSPSLDIGGMPIPTNKVRYTQRSQQQQQQRTEGSAGVTPASSPSSVSSSPSSLASAIFEAEGEVLFPSCITPREVKRLFRQIVTAVSYMHSNGFVHRDLKLENVLLNEEGDVWLGDFGMATVWESLSPHSEICGTLHYTAPELLMADRRYTGPEVDMWSLGVILYTLICGQFPFTTDARGQRIGAITATRNIKTASWARDPPVSSNVIHILKRLLNPDPLKRALMIDVVAALDQPWSVVYQDETNYDSWDIFTGCEEDQPGWIGCPSPKPTSTLCAPETKKKKKTGHGKRKKSPKKPVDLGIILEE